MSSKDGDNRDKQEFTATFPKIYQCLKWKSCHFTSNFLHWRFQVFWTLCRMMNVQFVLIHVHLESQFNTWTYLQKEFWTSKLNVFVWKHIGHKFVFRASVSYTSSKHFKYIWCLWFNLKHHNSYQRYLILRLFCQLLFSKIKNDPKEVIVSANIACVFLLNVFTFARADIRSFHNDSKSVTIVK